MNLFELARGAQQTIVNDICELVDVETHSYDLPALDRGLKKVRDQALRIIGEPSSSELYEFDDHGDTLVLTYPGNCESHVLLIAHYDTVWPTGTLESWPERFSVLSDGTDIITGPGIFDMKTGLIQGLWATKFLRDQAEHIPSVTLLFNGDEELGSPQSRPVIEKYAQGKDAVFVLEPSSGGKVKTGRKGVAIVRVQATGIESHAGLDPYKGASAIKALMEWCLAATELADKDKGTTINIGLLSGGTGSNVIAGQASAAIDIRVSDPSEFNRLDSAFDKITWSDERVKIDTDRDWNRPPMVLQPGSEKLYGLLEQAASEFGHHLESVTVGGGSDANFVSALGVPVVCGAGAVGDGAHARNEYIVPSAIPLFTAMVARAMQLVASQNLGS